MAEIDLGIGVLAMVDSEERTLTRGEYWFRFGVVFLISFVVGWVFADLPETEFRALQLWLSVLTAPFMVYWGIARCRDAGWHPGWAVVCIWFIGAIIVGIPGSKRTELRLVDG